jgi:hypothetical protein
MKELATALLIGLMVIIWASNSQKIDDRIQQSKQEIVTRNQ